MQTYQKTKDSGVAWLGDIPEEWSIEKVKRVFTRKNEKPEQEDPIVLSLARSGVKVRDISTNEGQLASSYSRYNPVEPGDILLNPMDLQSGANCSVSEVEGVISPAYINLMPEEGFNSKYFDYYFKTQYWSMAFFAHGKGVSYDNRWTLGIDTLMHYPIVLPPRPQQKKIADFLDEETTKIDDLIAKQEKLLKILEEKRKATISYLVSEGLDPNVDMKGSSISWLGQIPSQWTVSRLGFLGVCQNGINIGGDAFGSGTPFVSYGDVYANRELPEKVAGLVEASEIDKSSYSVERGDIFFTRTSETVEEIGFASVCMSDIEDAVFAGFLIRFRPTNSRLTPEFAKYYFQSSILREYLNKEMNVVTRASLSQGLLKKIPVILPPVEIQRQIVELLDKQEARVNSLRSLIRREIELLKERKVSLITCAVTGKIKV